MRRESPRSEKISLPFQIASRIALMGLDTEKTEASWTNLQLDFLRTSNRLAFAQVRNFHYTLKIHFQTEKGAG